MFLLFQIVFEGVRGKGFDADIAIDDFSLEKGSCNGGGATPPPATQPPGKCDFGVKLFIFLTLPVTVV